MKRILAHKIVYDGHTYSMSVVTIENNRVVEIVPFNGETEATIFMSGTITIETDNTGNITSINND